MDDEAVDLKTVLEAVLRVERKLDDVVATVNNLLGVSEQNLEAVNELTDAIRPNPEERQQFKSALQEAMEEGFGRVIDRIEELPDRVANALDEPVG